MRKPKPMKSIKVKDEKPKREPKNFKGYLRCDTGVRDLDKARIILIKSSDLKSKREKYPNLIVQGTVTE